MDSDRMARALAAVKSGTAALGLSVDDVVVIYNSNKLALRLMPCDVVARVAVIGREVAALELAIAQQLLANQAPVAALAAGVEPRVHQWDGFAVTLWHYYDTSDTDSLPPLEYASALEQFHAGMRSVEVGAPHFTERIKEAHDLAADRELTPALDADGRALLLSTLRSVSQKIASRGAAEQLLHGEPHPGNILNSASGPKFIDLETCCRGPVEFDLAHVPPEASALYIGADHDLVNECRRLVLAMVAAWRWDASDEFPNGIHHGRSILALLRNGPPWPTIGELPNR